MQGWSTIGSMKFILFCIFLRESFHWSSSLFPIMEEAITFRVREKHLHSLETCLAIHCICSKTWPPSTSLKATLETKSHHSFVEKGSILTDSSSFISSIGCLLRVENMTFLTRSWLIHGPIFPDGMLYTCRLKTRKNYWPSNMQTISSWAFQHLFRPPLNWFQKCAP